MASSLKVVLGLVLLGSALGGRITHPIAKSGWLKGSRFEAPGGHIWGGQDAYAGQFPHQTVVYTTNADGDTFICGGSVISADYVLTAAHCPNGGVSVLVVLGANNRNAFEYSQEYRFATVGTDDVKIHEDYNGNLIINDLALIRMDPPLEFGSFIDVIPLSREEPPVGTEVILSGWGRTGDEDDEGTASVLQYATVTIAEDSLCGDTYGYKFLAQIICLDPRLTGASSCGGDSGGPMNYDTDTGRVIAGVTSFGAESGCAQGFPIAYVSIFNYLDWIELYSGVTPA